MRVRTLAFVGAPAWRWAWRSVYVLAVAGGLWAGYYRWAYDDPFITYRYADNLARGLGFVYNPGEAVLSTTTPLFTLLLAALSNPWLDLPPLAVALGALSLAVGALCLWELARAWHVPLAGWWALFLYPTFTLAASTLSSETPLYLALCLAAFALYARRRFGLAAVCAGLAVLARADGLLVPGLLALDFAARRRGPLPWRPALIFLGLVSAWALFAWAYFGSPIPVTLAAKQQQGSLAISQKFAAGFVGLARGFAGHWLYWLEAGLAAAGLVFAFRRARQWLVFLAWPAVYFAAYAYLGVSSYFWYYAPLVPGFVMAAGLGAEWLAGQARAVPGRWRGLALAGLLGLAFAAQSWDVYRLSRAPDQRYRIYRAAGEWLRANTPPDAVVGTLEVGIIGYYARRPMVDFAGLIQPAVAGQLAPAATYADAADWALSAYRPDWLVLNPAWFAGPVQQRVETLCRPRQILTGQAYGHGSDLAIYECQWPR